MFENFDAKLLDDTVNQLSKRIEELSEKINQLPPTKNSDEQNTEQKEEINQKNILSLCLDTLLIIRKKKNLQECCPYFLYYEEGYLIERFEDCLNDIRSRQYDSINTFFILCVSILREFMLIGGRKIKIDSKIDNLWNKFICDEYHLSNLEPYQIQWLREIKFDLAAKILNFDIHRKFESKDFQAFLSFDESKKEAEKKMVEVNQYLSKRLKTVRNLSKKLNDLKKKLNFIALDKGFAELLEQKQKMLRNTFWTLVVLGVLLCIPVITKTILIIYGKLPAWNDTSWQELLAGIGLEFILIYFFRIVLNRYHSLQAQITQLELRHSLCQFIQDYAEYSVEIKSKDKVALEKFENLIFSSIMPSEKQIPSTFDGLEQITNLLKEVRSK